MLRPPQNVYTWTKVATSLPWGDYASCNPLPSDPSGRTWHCSGHGHSHGPGPPPPPSLNDLNMGRASISRFGHGQFDGDIYAPALSKLLSNSTSGYWYSNLHEGDCDSPNATACRWKVLSTVDSKNASCVNGQIEKDVLGRNNPCFGTCSNADLHNTTSDCWIDWCVDQSLSLITFLNFIDWTCGSSDTVLNGAGDRSSLQLSPHHHEYVA